LSRLNRGGRAGHHIICAGLNAVCEEDQDPSPVVVIQLIEGLFTTYNGVCERRKRRVDRLSIYKDLGEVLSARLTDRDADRLGRDATGVVPREGGEPKAEPL
jgi:hypothetical protein